MKILMTITTILLTSMVLQGQACISGIINRYTPVTNFGCDSSVVTVGSTLGFHVGDEVLLIQMQGAITSTVENATFGNILQNGGAGNYSFNRIKKIHGQEIHLTYQLSKPFNIAGKVQMIYVPEFDSVNVCDVKCQEWNGTTGGVLVLDVKDKLVLQGSIDVSASGFRGGESTDAGFSVYNQTKYVYDFDPAYSARKGEGIATPTLGKCCGRGKIANGGGGGNAHNAGGGGGGNGGNGGLGGLEYNNASVNINASPGTNGIGGLQLTNPDQTQAYMGGGGGAGHMNDGVGTSGGQGAGIVIISAHTIQSNNAFIYADGQSVTSPSDSNDGHGGGGAGGTVMIDYVEISGNLYCNQRGGNGGDCFFHDINQIIGPGGGGGGGQLLLSQPSTQIISDLSGGQNGKANQNSSNGATPGESGFTLTDLKLVRDSILITSGVSAQIEVIPPACEDPNTGSLIVQPITGGLFSLDGGPFQFNSSFSNLAPGTHSVEILFSNGCILDTSITIIQPSPIQSVSLLVTPINCRQNGAISVTPSSGTPPYLYSINGGNYQPIALFQNLTQGTYQVTVIDSNLCKGTLAAEIKAYSHPKISIEKTQNIDCIHDFGSATLLAEGGNAPYTFILSDTILNSVGYFDHLSSDNYLAYLIDADTCKSQIETF
ncbi:MAG: SprB repeat-containing protein, partial [Saprospiraceae bacterium]|nr:SprB repeat-containing protein [Saprospiraceae bacterium]